MYFICILIDIQIKIANCVIIARGIQNLFTNGHNKLLLLNVSTGRGTRIKVQFLDTCHRADLKLIWKQTIFTHLHNQML